MAGSFVSMSRCIRWSGIRCHRPRSAGDRISFLSAVMFIFQLTWSVGVIVMLYRICRR